MDKSTKECCEECFKWGEHYGEYVHPCHNPECECHKKVTMDKNKWIDGEIEKFKEGFLHDKKFKFYPWLRQSLEEAINFGRDQGVNGWKTNNSEE